MDIHGTSHHCFGAKWMHLCSLDVLEWTPPWAWAPSSALKVTVSKKHSWNHAIAIWDSYNLLSYSGQGLRKQLTRWPEDTHWLSVSTSVWKVDATLFPMGAAPGSGLPLNLLGVQQNVVAKLILTHLCDVTKKTRWIVPKPFSQHLLLHFFLFNLILKNKTVTQQHRF